MNCGENQVTLDQNLSCQLNGKKVTITVLSLIWQYLFTPLGTTANTRENVWPPFYIQLFKSWLIFTKFLLNFYNNPAFCQHSLQNVIEAQKFRKNVCLFCLTINSTVLIPTLLELVFVVLIILDVGIGAPYEEKTGVVYVFNGSADGLIKTPAQVHFTFYML